VKNINFLSEKQQTMHINKQMNESVKKFENLIEC